jgi:hypothetical protein
MNEERFRQWLNQRLQHNGVLCVGRELGVTHAAVIRWRDTDGHPSGPVLKLAGLIAAMERDQHSGIPIRKRKPKSKP